MCSPVLEDDPNEGRCEAQIRDKDGMARRHLPQIEHLEEKADNDENLETRFHVSEFGLGGVWGLAWSHEKQHFCCQGTPGPQMRGAWCGRHLAVGKVCRKVHKHCPRAPVIKKPLLLESLECGQHLSVKPPELRDKAVLDVATIIRRPCIRHLRNEAKTARLEQPAI